MGFVDEAPVHSITHNYIMEVCPSQNKRKNYDPVISSDFTVFQMFSVDSHNMAALVAMLDFVKAKLCFNTCIISELDAHGV